MRWRERRGDEEKVSFSRTEKSSAMVGSDLAYASNLWRRTPWAGGFVFFFFPKIAKDLEGTWIL